MPLLDRLLLPLFCLLLAFYHPLVFALKTDTNQATKLSSDRADFNDVTQEYILTGHVVIIKGSIVIKGAKAVVTVDPEGYQQITVVGNADQLASFTQQLDKPDPEFMDGEGDLIFYEAKKNQLLLSGQAYTNRRKGLQSIDKLVADKINYDLYTEEYSAVSKELNKPTRTVLAPRKNTKFELQNTKK
jgi:lipopolysaccharide export system protein LptA